MDKKIFESMTDEQLSSALSAIYDSEVRDALEMAAGDRFAGGTEDLYGVRSVENEIKN